MKYLKTGLIILILMGLLVITSCSGGNAECRPGRIAISFDAPDSVLEALGYTAGIPSSSIDNISALRMEYENRGGEQERRELLFKGKKYPVTVSRTVKPALCTEGYDVCFSSSEEYHSFYTRPGTADVIGYVRNLPGDFSEGTKYDSEALVDMAAQALNEVCDSSMYSETEIKPMDSTLYIVI